MTMEATQRVLDYLDGIKYGSAIVLAVLMFVLFWSFHDMQSGAAAGVLALLAFLFMARGARRRSERPEVAPQRRL